MMWVVAALVLGAAATPPPVSSVGPLPKGRIQRVVSLAPSLTQSVLALERGSLLVGVSRFDDDPALASLPRAGGISDVALETVVGLRPDLVLAITAPGNRQSIETLGRLGVPVHVCRLTTTADVRACLESLGRLLEASEAVTRLLTHLDQTRARIRAQSAQQQSPPPKVLVLFGLSPLVVAGPGTFADELLKDVGARNAAPASRLPYPVVPLEAAMTLGADIVIDASMSGEREHPRVRAALRKATWKTPGSTALLQPGPRLADALVELSRLVWNPPESQTEKTP